MNNTFNNTELGTNWNSILNALPKNQRGLYKLTHIAEPERQKVGTPSFRILNVYAGTHSPTVGHPWAVPQTSVGLIDATSLIPYTITVTQGSLMVTQAGATGAGLLVFKDIMTGNLFSISISSATMLLNSYTGPIPSIASLVLVDTVTNKFYNLYVSNGTLNISEM